MEIRDTAWILDFETRANMPSFNFDCSFLYDTIETKGEWKWIAFEFEYTINVALMKDSLFGILYKKSVDLAELFRLLMQYWKGKGLIWLQSVPRDFLLYKPYEWLSMDVWNWDCSQTEPLPEKGSNAL